MYIIIVVIFFSFIFCFILLQINSSSNYISAQVNRPVTFTVDASQAGEGTLELVVTTAKASVRAEVAARSRGLYDVTFTPHEAIPHFVNITFNEEEVIGKFQ